jgi:trans-L-3-hydroxyproline dehydratase
MSDVYRRIRSARLLETPDRWRRIRTIDLHTAGEPLRVVVDGYAEIEGDSVLACRRHASEKLDHLRTALMFEPRGHADMYGCLLLPPFHPDADFGVLFLHNDGYSTMCGHAILALATLAVRAGWVKAREPSTELAIEAPCGLIRAAARVESGEVRGASFECVPSFAVGLDRLVEVPGLGTVSYDLAYGGAFYAYVDARPLGLKLEPGNVRELIDTGMAIKRAVAAADPDIAHPFEPDLGFLYGTIFIGDPQSDDVDSRNVCIFADGEVDRSPTGSGVSGRMALHFARGEIGIGEPMRIESILGTVFTGTVARETDYGPHRAVVPRVEGSAYVVGRNEWLIDPDDPLKDGFLLR